MREITQSAAVVCRMVQPNSGAEHRCHTREGGEPMQLLRASAVALPFVALAIVVGLLSLIPI
jgi:hypothetical protein